MISFSMGILKVRVFSRDFQRITSQEPSGRSDQLFRASAYAFCSIPRPTRDEATQFRDLAMGLYDSVSDESRQIVAETISRSAHAPHALVMRLIKENFEIASPLLSLSPALQPKDIVDLVATQDWRYAQAITKRNDLDPSIRRLLHLLIAKSKSTPQHNSAPILDEQKVYSSSKNVEAVRDKLRTSMASNASIAITKPTTKFASSEQETIDKMRSSALFQDLDELAFSIATELKFDVAKAVKVVKARDHNDLIAVMRAMNISLGDAIVIIAGLRPSKFDNAQSVLDFLQSYTKLSVQDARDKVMEWRKKSALSALNRPQISVPSNVTILNVAQGA